jgi:hypothetical protein
MPRADRRRPGAAARMRLLSSPSDLAQCCVWEPATCRVARGSRRRASPGWQLQTAQTPFCAERTVLLTAGVIIPPSVARRRGASAGGIRAPLVAPLRIGRRDAPRDRRLGGEGFLLACSSSAYRRLCCSLLKATAGPANTRVLTARTACRARPKAPGSRGGAPRERGEKAYERAVAARKRAGPSAWRKPVRTITARRTPAGAWHHRSAQTQF